jgi:hypothetical protein
MQKQSFLVLLELALAESSNAIILSCINSTNVSRTVRWLSPI